ncbi:MAG: hypothetical protein IPO32_12185 [Crocinitomicaceae bacterium]|nr:hypothetical protein [Crocinitomicaceae bacterium]
MTAPQDHVQHIVFNSLEDLAEITMEKNDNIHEDDLVVIDMRVADEHYETKDGIKVGSTVTELTGKYTDTKFRYNGLLKCQHRRINATTGVQFVIDPSGCTKSSGSKAFHCRKTS